MTFAGILRFPRSTERWEQEPLAAAYPLPVPPELAVLARVTQPDEVGAWLNSRSIVMGAVAMGRNADGRLRTVRLALPGVVTAALRTLRQASDDGALPPPATGDPVAPRRSRHDNSKLHERTAGMPALVLWKRDQPEIRFVEVRCPHWDTLSDAQRRVHAAAQAMGFDVTVVEWEFDETPAQAPPPDVEDLIQQVIDETERVWGPEGFHGDTAGYAWLAQHGQISEEDDVRWLAVLDEHAPDEGDGPDDELRTFVADPKAVVEFLISLLGRYRGTPERSPQGGADAVNYSRSDLSRE